MTSTQAHNYVTPSDFFIPDRVIFTYTNKSTLWSTNASLNPWANDNVSSTTVKSSLSSSSWWWSHYPSGYSWPHIIVGAIIITVIILMILIGNFLVMWAIIHDRTLKTSQNLFIASLALADFFLGLIIIPFSLTNELMGYWLFGVIWCELYKAIDVLLCTASIMSLCLIALDRYWSITRAVHYARQRTRKRAAVMIFTVWFISAVVSIPPLIGWKQPTRESDWPLCTLSADIGYVVYSAFGSFFIPAFIMVFVYFKIYQAAKQRARKNVAKAPVGTTGDKAEHKHSTESSVTEHAAAKEDGGSNEHLDEDSHAECPGNITEETACDTGAENAAHSTLSEEDNVTTGNRVPELVTRVIQDGESRNIPSTDSDSEPPGGMVLNMVERGRPGFQPVPTSDTDSSDHIRKEDSVVGPQVESDHNNGGVRRFKILELRANGTSIAKEDPKDSQKDSVFKTIRQHLLEPRRGSRSKKNVALRPEPGKPIDFQTADRQKRKLAKARERRATVVLGLVMAAFILCWLPFFCLYLASAFCGDCIPQMVFTVFFWIGYCNSALNPIIYTVFNRDFRRAFQRIIFGRKQGRR